MRCRRRSQGFRPRSPARSGDYLRRQRPFAVAFLPRKICWERANTPPPRCRTKADLGGSAPGTRCNPMDRHRGDAHDAERVFARKAHAEQDADVPAIWKGRRNGRGRRRGRTGSQCVTACPFESRTPSASTGTPTSACFKTPAICSTENRFFFTTTIPLFRNRFCRKTHFHFGSKSHGPVTKETARYLRQLRGDRRRRIRLSQAPKVGRSGWDATSRDRSARAYSAWRPGSIPFAQTTALFLMK